MLELELEDVAVQQNSNCLALLGVDVLQGRFGVLGPATICLGPQDAEQTDIRFNLPKIHSIAIVPLIPARDKKGGPSPEEAEAGFTGPDPEEPDSPMKLLAKPTLSPN